MDLNDYTKQKEENDYARQRKQNTVDSIKRKQERGSENEFEDRDEAEAEREVKYYLGQGMFLQERIAEIKTKEEMVLILKSSLKNNATHYSIKGFIQEMVNKIEVMNLSLEDIKNEILIEMSIKLSTSLKYKEENFENFVDEDRRNLKRIEKLRKSQGLKTSLSMMDIFMINDMQNHGIKITDDMISKYKELYKFNIVGSDLNNISEFSSDVQITSKNIEIARSFKENGIKMNSNNFITIQIMELLLKEKFNVTSPFKINSHDVNQILTKLIQFKEEKSFMQNVKGMFNSKEEREENGIESVKSIVGNELIM